MEKLKRLLKKLGWPFTLTIDDTKIPPSVPYHMVDEYVGAKACYVVATYDDDPSITRAERKAMMERWFRVRARLGGYAKAAARS